MDRNNNYIDDDDGIPENAHKMLFAEDLVRYVMQRDEDLDYSGDRFDPFEEHVYDGFNETTRKAVEFLLSTMEMEHELLFKRMQSDHAVSSGMYMRLANDMGASYFKDGFDANRFLNYCAQLASLAVHFYADGIEEAPVLAVSSIVKAIQNVDMTTGGWETLDISARRLAAMSRDTMSRLSPETGSSDDEEVDLVAPDEADPGVPEADHAAVADRHSVESNSGANEGSAATQNNPRFDETLVQNQSARSKSDSEAQDSRIESICVGNKKAVVASGLHESCSSSSASEINNIKGNGFEKESSSDFKLNPGASRVVGNEPCPETSYAEKELFVGNKLNPGPSCLANNEKNPVNCVVNKRDNARTSFDDRNINLYFKSDVKRKLYF